MNLHPIYQQVPSHPKKLKFDPSSAVVHETDGWQLSKVMELSGCKAECAKEVHGLSEYDILMAHSSFQSKSLQQQREWIHEYFATHCPNTVDGVQDVKNISFIIMWETCVQTSMASLSVFKHYSTIQLTEVFPGRSTTRG